MSNTVNLDLLDGHTIGSATTFALTADKEYTKLQQYVNVTSFSILELLHTCPRKFQLVKSRAASGLGGAMNTDFAFGHSVGSGVQSWLITNDIDAAVFNAMMAWKLPYDMANDKKKKSIWDATLAVLKYPAFHAQQLENWKLFVLPSGKPAIELAIEVDFENGYKHYIHIDAVMVNEVTGQLAIQENKTHGFKEAEGAIYANSSQALSYAVITDMLQTDTNYEVFYAAYSAPGREWELLPFNKSSVQRAEWLTDVRLDHAAISTYRELQFFPKRGASCFNFMRRCEFFGECNLISDAQVKELPENMSAEETDYQFKLSELLANQRERIGV